MSKVYFTQAESSQDDNVIANKVWDLLSKSGLDKVFSPNDFTAIKIHVGEDGCNSYMRPGFLQRAVTKIRNRGSKVFLTDTATLYSGRRSNGAVHAALAQEHGFTYENTGAAFIPADGLYGDNETMVEIDGHHCKQVSVADEILRSQSMLVFSHLTGHVGTGFAATLKNLGMGCVGRQGKRQQHCSLLPAIKPSKCVACGECIIRCEVKAMTLSDGKMAIDDKTCTGCGQCLAVCRFDAITFDWGVHGVLLQERIAEHALGVVKGKQGKIAYVIFLMEITPVCDCMPNDGQCVIDDIGIIVSDDPVAADRAAADLVYKAHNQTLSELSGCGEIDIDCQVVHGAKIGLGSLEYEMITIE